MLADVNVTFQPGRIAAVLGPNGAGKTTLLGILSTLVTPSAGEVRWGGEVLGRGSAARARIGYVGHEPGIYGDLTAAENVALFAGLHGVPDGAGRAPALLARVGLGDAQRDAPARTFSRGMLQRLALARALVHDPTLAAVRRAGRGAGSGGRRVADGRARGRAHRRPDRRAGDARPGARRPSPTRW